MSSFSFNIAFPSLFENTPNQPFGLGNEYYIARTWIEANLNKNTPATLVSLDARLFYNIFLSTFFRLGNMNKGVEYNIL